MFWKPCIVFYGCTFCGTDNLVVDDEMTENEFRNEESTEIILTPKAAMAVDEKHGSTTSVGVSSQSDQLGGSKNSLKPSFRDMLTGKGGGTQHSNFISELDVELGDSDVIIGKVGSLPKIHFSDRVHQAIDAKLSKSLIVRLLGKTIGYRALLSRVQTLWNLSGEMHLIDLDNDYFLVRFAMVEDYDKVLSGGPWMVYDSYLTVQPWSQDFSTSAKFPSKVLVWVRLPGLPYRYYTKSLFRAIAGVLGSVVRIDYNTKEGKRGRFARLAIMVNLVDPLVPGIMIDGHKQIIEYEGLPLICYGCGKYGHLKEACGQSQVVEVAVPSQRQDSNSSSEPYGPWMQVVNQRGRGSVAPHKALQEGVNRRFVAGASGSRFDALYVLGEGEVNFATSRTGHPMAKGGGAVSPALADVGGQMAMEPKAHSSPTRRVRAISSSVPLGGITKMTSPKNSMVVRVGEIIPQQSEVTGELASTDKEVGAILEVSETDSMVPVDHVEDELVGAIQEVHENDSMVSVDQVEDELVRGRSIAAKEKVIYAPSSLNLDKHTALRVVDRVDRGALKETNGRPMHGPIRVSTSKSVNHKFSLSKGLSCKGSKLKKKDGNEMEQPTLQTWAVNFSNSLNKIVPTTENSLLTHDSTDKVQWRQMELLKHKPDISAIMEPRVSGPQADGFIRGSGFEFSYMVEANGFSGGIWVLWNSTVKLDFLARKYIWEQLQALTPPPDCAWILGGNFNSICNSQERPLLLSTEVLVWEWECLNPTSHIAWETKLGRRIKGSYAHAAAVPRARVRVIRVVHTSARQFTSGFGCTNSGVPCSPRGNFCLQLRLHTSGQFVSRAVVLTMTRTLLENAWKNEDTILSNLLDFQDHTRVWNREVFGHIGRQSSNSPFLMEVERELKSELNCVLEQEERFWHQKSRSAWIANGDRNTRFFHASTLARRKRNSIRMLRIGDGAWCDGSDQLRVHAVEYFKLLFSSEERHETFPMFQGGFNQWESLKCDIDAGGLGIKDLDRQNQALLMKLGFELVVNTNKLWVKVLKAKYRPWRGLGSCSAKYLSGMSEMDFTLTFGGIVADDSGVHDNTIGWDVSHLVGLLPAKIISKVVATCPPRADFGSDRPGWRWEESQVFSTRSAYKVLSPSEGVNYSGVWRMIWSLQLPQIIQVFLWLAFHNRLLTNKERHHRHLVDSSCCPFCTHNEEELSHVLRHCGKANQVWSTLIKPSMFHEFMSKPLDVWLEENLRGNNSVAFHDFNWNVLFVVIVTALGCPRSDATLAKTKFGLVCGVAFWVARSLGSCSVIMAELWATHDALLHACRMGYRKVELECDSRQVVDILKCDSLDLIDSDVVTLVHELLRRQWEVRIRHVRREANSVADKLVKLMRGQPRSETLYVDPPAEVSEAFLQDQLV
ncbi:hypothetical protein GQ457_18G007610 [Hibiscus cannabinus]